MVVNGNTTPPHSGDVESDDDDDDYEEIIDLRKPSPDTKTPVEPTTDVEYDVLAPVNPTPQVKSSQSPILNPEADIVHKPSSTSNVTAEVEVNEAAILPSGPQDTYDVPTSSKPASQMMKSHSAMLLTESVYKVPTSSHAKSKSEVAEETAIQLSGTDHNYPVPTSTSSAPLMKTSGSATLTPRTDNIYNVPKSPNVLAKSKFNEAAVLTPGTENIYHVPKSTDVSTVLNTNETAGPTRETSKSLPKRTIKPPVPLPTGGRSQAAVQKTVSGKSRTLSEGTSLTNYPAAGNVYESVH